jgi:hypothetical protein
MRRVEPFLKILMIAVLLVGCEATIPKEALKLSPESLSERQLQTRRFDTADEAKMLSASAALLQDLGFNLDESETKLGVIVASKTRDAVEAQQVVGSILLTVLLGAPVPYDKVQKMRASVVTKPVGESEAQLAVRVTFQRIVWNTQNRISKQERLNDPKAYQAFFSKLSKAVFLEAHEI